MPPFPRPHCSLILAVLLCAILPVRAEHTVNGVPGVIKPTDITQENYGRDVENFWATHKYNTASPNYDVTVPTRPGGSLTANGTKSLQQWIYQAVAENKTLVLPAGSTWNACDVIDKSNVHIVCPDPANKAKITGLFRVMRSSDWSTSYNDRTLIYNPTHNYYFKNISFDGGSGGSPTGGAYYCVMFLEAHDILFDGCELVNCRNTNRGMHDGNIRTGANVKNIWLVNCYFNVGCYAVCLDGDQDVGLVNCTIGPSWVAGGGSICFFTNDDNSYDANANKVMEWNETLITDYGVVANNTWQASTNNLGWAIAYHGAHGLFLNNTVQNRTVGTFLDLNSRWSYKYPGTIYKYYNNVVKGNTVNASVITSFVNWNDNQPGSKAGIPPGLGMLRSSNNTIAGALADAKWFTSATTYGSGTSSLPTRMEGPNYVWNNKSNNLTSNLTVSYPSTDVTPPAAPTNLRTTHVGSLGVTLAWNAPADSDVYAYDIYRKDPIDKNFRLLASVTAPTLRTSAVQGIAPATTYADGHRIGSSLYDIHDGTGQLEPGTNYEYYVRAVDLTGANESLPSSTIAVTTAPATTSATITMTQGNATSSWPEEPSAVDQGQTAIIKAADGYFKDEASQPIASLFNGVIQPNNNNTSESFFTKWGNDYTFLLDLGSVKVIDKINTYSWHSDRRRWQYYALYASDADVAPGAMGDLEANGWRFVAWVDSYFGTGSGEKNFVRITGAGNARHLCFSLRTGRHLWGGTLEQLPAFMGEIDVFTTDISTATVAPPAPSALVINGAATTSSIPIRWTDNALTAANNESSFSIERSADNATWAPIASNSSGVVTFTDTGLTAGTPYYYRIRAINPIGNSAYTTVLAASTQAPPAPPAAPTALTAVVASHSAIDLSWTDNSADESGFRVESSTDNATWTNHAAVAADTTRYSVTGLTASTTYFFRVRATNAVGSSAYCDALDATTQDLPATPTAPTGLSAAAASSSCITLTWSHDAANVTGFEVERSIDQASWMQTGTLGPSSRSFVDSGLSALTPYYYRIRAVNSEVPSPYSSTSTATTGAPTTVPAAPGSLALTVLSSSSIRLVWVDNSTDETGFKVERSTDQATWLPVNTVAANTTSFTDTGLAASTLYYYRLRATNGIGDSTNAPAASATTQSAAAVAGNVFPDPSFETAGTGSPMPPSGWMSRSYMSRNATDAARTGGATMKFAGDANSGATTAYTFYNGSTVSLSPSTDYEFTAYVHTNAVAVTGHGVRIFVQAPSAAGSTIYQSSYQFANGSDWVQVKLSFRTPATAASGWGVRICPLLSAGETVWVDDIALAPLVSNVAPTDMTLSASTANENAAAGTAIGTLSATDDDSNDSHTFTLVAGAGDTDNSLFAIAGNALTVAGGLDFEAKPSCSVRIRTSDAAGATFEKNFAITINNLPETPYEHWAQTKFGTGWTNTAVAGASVPGTDGIPNLLRYALNLPDVVTGQQGMPAVTAEGGNVTFTYEVDTAKSDITCTPESSTDLVSWSPADTRAKLSASGTLETWKASIALGANNRAFFRLKVAR